MKLITWYRDKYLSFGGRLPRTSYFLGSLVVNALAIAVIIPAVFISSAKTVPTTVLLVIVVALVGAIYLASTASLTVRRFHDFNFSGWAIIPYVVLTIIIAVVEESAREFGMAGLTLTAAMANFVLGLVILFVPGSAGENKFGPPVYRADRQA